MTARAWLALALTACYFAASSNACPTPYTIKSGDTFDSLAKISGLSLVNLEAANPGVDYANIQVGQQVTIPCSEAATAPVLPPPGAAPAGAGACSSIYTIEAGDNLQAVADRQGISLAVMQAANPQISNPSAVQPGDVITLPCQCTSSYLIQQNDNLQNLAVKYLGTTDYSQLLAANPWIKDPNAIVAGTHLNIPPCSTSLGPCPEWYLVGQGETLQTISAHCARSQLALQQLNKLADPNAITAGQVYHIYDNSAPAPAPAGGGGSSTGAIAGGVVGGVAAAILFAVLALAFVIRQRTGQWPGLRRLPHQDPEDAARLGSVGQSGGSSRQGLLGWRLTPGHSTDTEMTSSSDDSMQPDAGTKVLAKMRTQGGKMMQQGLCDIRPEEIEILKNPDGSDVSLGSGGYGQVFKAMRGGVDVVAVKVMKGKTDARTAQAFTKEIGMLSEMRHSNILQYWGCCCVQGHTYLVTEFCSGGDLFNALVELDTQYSWHQRPYLRGLYELQRLTVYKSQIRADDTVMLDRGKFVALEVASALAYLHSRAQVIVHQDVKSHNILLQNGTAKLADVGLARVLSHTLKSKPETTAASAAMGTYAWAAPEKLMGTPATEKADIWSFGVVLHEICTQEIPVRGGMRPIRPEEAPPAIKDAVWRCLDPSPAERPTAKELVQLFRQEIGGFHS